MINRMKHTIPLSLLLMVASLSISLPTMAFPGLSIVAPEDVGLAAKYAKEKARIAYDQSENADRLNTLNANNTNGCDLNVGNVLIDENALPNTVPNELVVIVEGDIVQANECSTR